MNRLLLFVFLMISGRSVAFGQVSPDTFFQGYQRDIHGFPFIYHSPLPNVSESLIVRANKDFRPIEWETETIPENYTGATASFVWAYGMDTDVKGYYFDLYVNGEKYFTFTNPSGNEQTKWSVHGKNGAVLTFHVTMIDKYRDQMGFVVLSLPRMAFVPGEPVKLTMDGEDSADGNIWYMTFKSAIKDTLSIHQENVVKQEAGKEFYLARFDFTFLGEPSNCEIKVNHSTVQTILNPGYNSVELKLPKYTVSKKYTAQIKIENRPEKKVRFTMNPVKEWYIYLVQHTHTDIGYTRPQTEILPEHLRYIDYALDYCDQTDDYPDEAQFRWTCEASWAVREYLKSRPEEQIDRLIKRVKEGRIEVTGMFFNFSDIIDEAGLAAQTRTIRHFKEKGIEVSTAMQNDVNGIGWCLAEYGEDIGLKYLTMGQHGHRARIPFDQPTAFWWESPSGKKLLAYRSEHYMFGNTLGLISGDLKNFKTRLSEYLEQLEEKNYPFDRTAFQFSGYITDNSPPSTIACEMVRDWNEQYIWPKLRLAVDHEFMQFIEENHGDELQTRRVAWPDWWTDGAGSAMMETRATRTIQAEMTANNGLIAMASMSGAEFPGEMERDISDVQDDLLFYDEHTYGADQSISDPLLENSVIQWNEKAAYAWDAVKRSSLLREKAMGFMQSFLPRMKNPSIAIFNTLNWPRSGQVVTFIDHEILPDNKKFSIRDQEGHGISAQALKSRSDGTYWSLWVENIPPMGYKIYEIVVEEAARIDLARTSFDLLFENDFYRLKIDTTKGGISSLFDKQLNQELLDQTDTVQLGQFIYETLANRHQMERFTYNKMDTVYVPLDGHRMTLSKIEFSGVEEGPIWKSLFLKGKIPGCADDRGLNMEIRLFQKEKRIELHYALHKVAVYTPEAIYVAFPFVLAGGKIGFEAQGGVVYPGENQLEGTSSDWNGVQNFAFVRNAESQIVMGSNDVPLMQFGAINTGRFYYKHTPETNHIYSWVLNNYWTTNFKASQEGELKWSYYLTSEESAKNADATRFAWASRIPMLSRVFPSGESGKNPASASLITISPKNLLIVVARPSDSDKGIVLQVRETEGETAVIDKKELLRSNRFGDAMVVNVLEEKTAENDNRIIFKPFETKFILLK